ncbi:hypothetical protein [Nocardioides hankookensis]|uniref:DUF5666 domain-containing protein n=1 Tax=Nocardioides hankookensis TaxID=443157 RepID=A0ABW1LIJ7_9ACTN
MNLTRVTLATASSVLLVATLAACGGGSDDAATDTSGAAAQAGGAPNAGQGGRTPGASGTVAAVSGSTAQVQNDQSGQVAVSWTKGTTFTQQVDATLADVTVGSCVMVTDGDDDTAATVRITAANDDDGCGFGGGQRPDGAPSGMPSDMPTDRPSDMPSGGPGGMGGGFGTVGEVTSVSATGFTVSATQPGSEDASDVSVTVGDDTTYTTQAKAQASAVTVGRCVTARGDSDDTGAVVATTISVSDPVDGQCTGGFGGGGMRGPEGGAA